MQQREIWYQKARDLALISDGIASIDEQTAWKNYKFYRNKVNNKKKYDETDFKRKKLEENIDSPEKTWKSAKSFMNWKSSGTPSQIEVANKLITKASLIAEVMNNFFVDKVKQIRNSMGNAGLQLSSCLEIMAGKSCKLDLAHVTEEKVRKTLSSLTNSKSLAIDELFYQVSC